jgi:alpha-beta hydrolase superfamily lysophospholipase
MTERVVFTNSLGQRLAGLLHRPRSAHKDLGPTVILCHGMMSAKEGRKQVVFAGALEGCGFSVLRFDFSFCGESEGKFPEITFTQEVDDLAGAVRWVREHGGGPVGLLGSSMGGAVAVLYGSGDPGIRAVVTLAAVAFPQRLVERMDALKSKIQEWKEEGHMFGAEGDVGEAFFQDAMIQDVPAAIRGISAPVLILHGGLDEVVSVSDAHALHDNAGGMKRLKIFPEADHRFIRSRDLEEAVAETTAWFRTYLTPGEQEKFSCRPGPWG